jgi:hypothetical protein
MTAGGRVQLTPPATAGKQASVVENISRRHSFDEEGRRCLTRASKRPRGYEPNHRNKKYTEGTIHINMDMKENDPLRDSTI